MMTYRYNCNDCFVQAFLLMGAVSQVSNAPAHGPLVYLTYNNVDFVNGAET